MTIAYWCLFAAVIFPYIFCVLAKSGPGFDNHNPRESLDRLKGWRKRAHWVQLNSFEILPGFAAAVIIAHQVSPFNPLVDSLAISFILMRTLYAVCYIADKALLRTVCWILSFVLVLSIFLYSTLHSSYRGFWGHKESCAANSYKHEKMSKFRKHKGMSRNKTRMEKNLNQLESGKVTPSTANENPPKHFNGHHGHQRHGRGNHGQNKTVYSTPNQDLNNPNPKLGAEEPETIH